MAVEPTNTTNARLTQALMPFQQIIQLQNKNNTDNEMRLDLFKVRAPGGRDEGQVSYAHSSPCMHMQCCGMNMVMAVKVGCMHAVCPMCGCDDNCPECGLASETKMIKWRKSRTLNNH